MASAASVSAERRARLLERCAQPRSRQVAQTACTCLRQRGHGWHAPFGAPLPSILPEANFFPSWWCAKLGRASASRERFFTSSLRAPAKRSRAACAGDLDCFVAVAPRNDAGLSTTAERSEWGADTQCYGTAAIDILALTPQRQSTRFASIVGQCSSES